jgi:hypothetical protein
LGFGVWALGLANLGNDSRGTRRDVAGSITPSASVRHKQRVAAKKANINGVDNAKTVEWGRKVVEYRAEGTVTAIQKAIEK